MLEAGLKWIQQKMLARAPLIARANVFTQRAAATVRPQKAAHVFLSFLN